MKDAKNIMAIFEPEASSIIDMGFIAFVKYIYMSGKFMTFSKLRNFTLIRTLFIIVQKTT